MNVRRGFARLYLVLAVLAFGWLNRNVLQEDTGAKDLLQSGYRNCVESAMLAAYGSIPSTSPPIYYDGHGTPIYDATDYPDFAEWQVRARQETESMARVEKTRPAVENACAGVEKSAALRRRWIKLGEVGLKILGLTGLYWVLIWLARVARWIYRGFLTA